jgi:hypothetical protein
LALPVLLAGFGIGVEIGVEIAAIASLIYTAQQPRRPYPYVV